MRQKNYMYIETTNGNSPDPGMFWIQEVAQKTSEIFFPGCLPPPHSLLWSSAHHNAEANGSYDPIKARRDPLLLSITTSIIPYDVDDYKSSYYM